MSVSALSETKAVGRETSADRTGAVSASDWLLIIIPGIIWGASFLFIAEGLRVLTPMGVTFTRIAIGFVTLSCVPAARRPVQRSDWPGIAALGVLWLAFPLSMFPFAEQHVSSALTGMLNGATPLFATTVASLLARRAPTRRVVVGLIIGISGAALVALPTLGDGHNSVTGVLMILAALVSYGFAINVARPLQLRNGSLPVVWRALAVAFVLTAPFGLPAYTHTHFELEPWLCLLALGALGTALANVMVATVAGRAGATRASTTTFIMPIVALLLGMTIRHEHVAALSIAGGAICLIGAWVMNRPAKAAVR